MTTPLICATVTAATTDELRARRDSVAGADLVELRLDSVADPDVAGALAGRRTPLVVTCRPRWEGGGFAGSEEERHRLLGRAIDLGAEYVDVEARAGFDDLVRARRGRGIVLSFHDFAGVPADLAPRYHAMCATGAEVVKVAVTAGRLTDLIPLLELPRYERGHRTLIAMGRAGLPSRVLAARFGSCWTYAGDGVAPGQVPLRALIDDYRFRRVSAGAQVFGILGRPLGHSLSPAMHNAAFAHLGLDAVYVPFEAAELSDFFDVADRLDVRGVSVTAPYKRGAFTRAEIDDRLTRRVGAVNTLKRGGDRWFGTNTDVEAFLAPLEARMRLKGARVAIVGAGGAARSAAIGAASRGARVAVYARRQQAAADVARLVDGIAGALPPPRGSWDVLVHATPVGTAPHVNESVLEAASLDGGVVYDLVYNPPVTKLLREASRAGCDTIGGLAMLVGQALQQCAWWTGVRPPADVLEAAAVAGLGAPDGAGHGKVGVS